MRLSQRFLLLTAVMTAFAKNMRRNPYPLIKQQKPFYAPRQDSSISAKYIGQPCQYNSDYDPTITPYDRIYAEGISEKASLTIKFPGKWTRRNSCLQWSVPNFYGGEPDPNDGNPVECCIDLACSIHKGYSCRQYGVIENGCAGGVWADDPTECPSKLGLSRLNAQCCIGEKYKRTATKSSKKEVPKPAVDKASDPSSSPASTDPKLFTLGNDDRAARGAFLPPEKFPNGFTTGG